MAEIDVFYKSRKFYTEKQFKTIANEFKRLQDHCYLDHSGATLYSEIQMQNNFSEISSNIYANPHSMNISGQCTRDAIDIVRYSILEHFNTNLQEYSVIFTSGATASLKIIAECFNYGNDDNKGIFTYLENNHTSVLGMRNYSKNIKEIKLREIFQTLSTEQYKTDALNHESNNLFVYPAQCNFAGTKYPLEWIDKIKLGCLNNLLKIQGGTWFVVLDCASYVSTKQLDLSKYKPDFIPISFYKMFGYPTGLGALLVKKSSEYVMEKKYFGGGTVSMALSSTNIMIPRINFHERFEDGTLSYVSILAIKQGFDTIKRLHLNYNLISNHTYSLAQYVYKNLVTLHHSNGQPAVILYHDTIFENEEHQGSIVNFNLLRPNGEYIGYSEVLHMANLHNIHLRTGCFCNPGACQRLLKLENSDVIKHFEAGHVCGDQHDLVDGYPTGSVRISFGYMSTEKDAHIFLQMIETCFVAPPVVWKLPSNWIDLKENYYRIKNNNFPENLNSTYSLCTNNNICERSTEEENYKDVNNDGILQQIVLYPIKSCGAFVVPNRWKLTLKGLQYDREWMIVNSAGVCLTQKQNKKLCLIMPEINMESKTMKLKFEGQSDIEVNLEYLPNINKAKICQSKICRERVLGWDCGDNIAKWLSECLRMPGLRLLRQLPTNIADKDSPQISFANKSQYLLINTKSIEWLINKIPENVLNEDMNSIIQRFRPNFVVTLKQAFQENEVDGFLFDKIKFKTAGNCTRCQMICINQKTGETTKEPLLTLSRELKGKICFGIYLHQEDSNDEPIVNIGDRVINL